LNQVALTALGAVDFGLSEMPCFDNLSRFGWEGERWFNRLAVARLVELWIVAKALLKA
jgi:hypothetical protein